MDAAVENKIHVEKDGEVGVFEPSDDRLCHHDCKDEKMFHFEWRQKKQSQKK